MKYAVIEDNEYTRKDNCGAVLYNTKKAAIKRARALSNGCPPARKKWIVVAFGIGTLVIRIDNGKEVVE